MKIVSKERADKNFYDELIYVCNYIKRFLANPFSKVRKMTAYLRTYMIIIIFVGLLEILAYAHYQDKAILVVIGALAFGLYFLLICFYRTNKRIDEFRKNDQEIIVEIDKEEISYKTEELDVKMKWENVKNVILGKYGIIFLPVSVQYMVIAISMKYKEEIIECLKKYNKLDLLVDKGGSTNG